eukprot:CAMPEP_0113670236 /NCGR_PEP_ID=MMETSP0038_2-20120614/5024_1 /TAXON_ID=2898 /ORGANISM="Cryptomonas paramecium" /LENGTH=162 /DNA_ID=CAMNT_0000586229 /DNA_START=26 /DNA_END=510 /DNA_ORIENTATION=- /assembly_acc=CAM_ASM_000170
MHSFDAFGQRLPQVQQTAYYAQSPGLGSVAVSPSLFTQPKIRVLERGQQEVGARSYPRGLTGSVEQLSGSKHNERYDLFVGNTLDSMYSTPEGAQVRYSTELPGQKISSIVDNLREEAEEYRRKWLESEIELERLKMQAGVIIDGGEQIDSLLAAELGEASA